MLLLHHLLLLSISGYVSATPLFWEDPHHNKSKLTPQATAVPIPAPVQAPAPAPIPAPTQISNQIPDAATSPVSFTGRITYYGTDARADPGPNRSYGACEFSPAVVASNFAAINAAQYDKEQQCGQCIEIRYADQCTEAVVVDQCPGCPMGGLDLAFDTFATLVGSKAEATRRGFVNDVQWSWIVCNAGCQ